MKVIESNPPEHGQPITLATDKTRLEPPPHSIAARLMERRDQVLSWFVSRVRQAIGAARDERHPIIINTLPAFVENLAEALAPNYPRELATEGTTIATEHGGERARLTRYSPGELLQEYQILRDVLFEALGDGARLGERESRIIIKSIDQAMGESLMAYFLVHESIREQVALVLTHDLRTPLTAIQASADLILRRPERTDQVPLLAAKISENVRRIDRMTQDLLDASRLRSGERLNFEVSECDLLALARDTVAQLATVHGDRFALTGEPITGFWNGDAFMRAMENLLLNAVKYGNPTSPITLHLQKVHGRAIVSVRNEGAHIPAEEQENLFRSFMRAHTAERSGKRGWGLGLAMVRGMAEGHGGSIAVDSAPERGTTFVIDVPLDSRPYLASPLSSGRLGGELRGT